jgi:hypothetical protein
MKILKKKSNIFFHFFTSNLPKKHKKNAYIINQALISNPTMHTKNLTIDNRGQTQIIKQIRTVLPNIGTPIVFPTLVIKPVSVGQNSGLVVPPEQDHVFRVLELETEQEEEDLDAELASVDVVSQKEVVGFDYGAYDVEHVDQVVELAVDVSNDVDWG